MKVLFISRKFPPSTGGMELFAYDLSQALGAKTDLKLLKWGGSNRALPLVLPYLFIRALTKMRGVEVLHIQDGLLAPMGFVLAKLFHKPFVAIIHGLDVTYSNGLYQKVVPWCLRRAGAVICISQAAADEVVKRGISQSRVVVIPLAVADNMYGKATRQDLIKELELPDDSQILLTVGRLVKRKGVAWFIDNVLPSLVQSHANLHYLVIGEGAERAEIESAVKRRGLTEKVHLLGRVSAEVQTAAYNGADVFVMPNIAVPGDVEGFGLVTLEASLCALPVVAADLEGIKDALTDGQNGLLVPSAQAAGFVAAIERFVDDKNYARQFGQASRDFSLEHFQWDKLAGRYIEQYKRLLR